MTSVLTRDRLRRQTWQRRRQCGDRGRDRSGRAQAREGQGWPAATESEGTSAEQWPPESQEAAPRLLDFGFLPPGLREYMSAVFSRPLVVICYLNLKKRIQRCSRMSPTAPRQTSIPSFRSPLPVASWTASPACLSGTSKPACYITHNPLLLPRPPAMNDGTHSNLPRLPGPCLVEPNISQSFRFLLYPSPCPPVTAKLTSTFIPHPFKLARNIENDTRTLLSHAGGCV